MVATKKRVSQYKTSRISSSTRTLDDLPMSYTKSDSSVMAEKCRTIINQHQLASENAKVLSQKLFTDSRQLFDEALTKVRQEKENSFSTSLPSLGKQDMPKLWDTRDQLNKISPPLRNCYSSLSNRHVLMHTGPTAHGSLLYSNRTPLVTDRITIHENPPPDYFRATPDITKCLKESNNLFRTVSKDKERSRSSISERNYSSAQFLLIPVHKETDKYKHSTGRLSPVRHLLANDLDVVEDVASEHNEPPMIMIENEEGKPANGSVTKDFTVKFHGATKSDIREISPKPVKKLKDTSSDGKLEKQAKIIKAKTSEFMKDGKKKTKPNGKKKGKKAEQEEEQEEEDPFPTYICPSSETKSREAFTRRWIRSNTFTQCNRHLPLE